MGGRTLTTVVTSDTIALSAAIFGFAGHSIVTPHKAIEQIWWTEARINAKVTPQFITSRLHVDQRSRLSEQPAFADDDLTEDTYLEWILRNAKRLFLALLGCDKADHIFELIDAAWDDEDLPIKMEDVKYLVLAPSLDEQLNRWFYSCQHQYLLRPLSQSKDIAYGPNEAIPLEHVCKLPPAAALQDWWRIHPPQQSDRVLVQRKTKLFDKNPDSPELAMFRAQVALNYSIKHPHIAPLWATYSAKDCAYAVFDFVPEHTLKSFIEFRMPTSFYKLSEAERTRLLLNWMYCLTATVAYMHQRSVPCPFITPSNIIIDARNRIALSEVGRQDAFQRASSLTYLELYNYESPEQQNEPCVSFTQSSLDAISERAASWIRRISTEIFPALQDPPNKLKDLMDDAPAVPAFKQYFEWPLLDISKASSSSTNRSSGLNSPTKTASTSSSFCGGMANSPINAPKAEDTSHQGDVFSLGCVLLDIVSFMLGRRPYTEFVKFRSSKHRLGGNYKRKHIDASFHSNREKVLEWIEMLNSQGSKSPPVDSVLVVAILQIIKSMLNVVPRQRPTAAETLELIGKTMRSHAISRPSCCKALDPA